jgi:hypothetical protein
MGWMQGAHMQPEDCILRLDAVLPGEHLVLAQLQRSRHEPTENGGIRLPKRTGTVVIRAQDIRRVQKRQHVLLEDAPWLRESWLVDVHDAKP